MEKTVCVRECVLFSVRPNPVELKFGRKGNQECHSASYAVTGLAAERQCWPAGRL